MEVMVFREKNDDGLFVCLLACSALFRLQDVKIVRPSRCSLIENDQSKVLFSSSHRLSDRHRNSKEGVAPSLRPYSFQDYI